MRNKQPLSISDLLSISLLAQSALTRIGIALVLIVLTWLGVQWAVALQ